MTRFSKGSLAIVGEALSYMLFKNIFVDRQ